MLKKIFDLKNSAFLAYCVAMSAAIFLLGSRAVNSSYAENVGRFPEYEAYFTEAATLVAFMMVVWCAYKMIASLFPIKTDDLSGGLNEAVYEIALMLPSLTSGIIFGVVMSMTSVISYLQDGEGLLTSDSLERISFLDHDTLQIMTGHIVWAAIIYSITNALVSMLFETAWDLFTPGRGEEQEATAEPSAA